ncbi:PD-(D/E)XK nuclease family protein [Nocardia sp. NPDC055002]
MHRSVSQRNSYHRCSWGYKLERLDGCWQRPAAWLYQGTAVHYAAEVWELSGRTMSLEDAQDAYRESYAKETNEALAADPNMEVWFRSGPYAGEQDIQRRFQIGLEQVEKYLAWYAAHPWEVIAKTREGKLMAEIGFDMDLGGVKVRGYIDAVIYDEKRKLWIVRDNKTGNKPGDDFQLGTYKVALEEMGEVEPGEITIGDYWMGRTGKPTTEFDISDWTRDAIRGEFIELEALITAGEFEPDPEPNKCMFCNVQTSCSFAA